MFLHNRCTSTNDARCRCYQSTAPLPDSSTLERVRLGMEIELPVARTVRMVQLQGFRVVDHDRSERKGKYSIALLSRIDSFATCPPSSRPPNLRPYDVDCAF